MFIQIIAIDFPELKSNTFKKNYFNNIIFFAYQGKTIINRLGGKHLKDDKSDKIVNCNFIKIF